MKSKEINTIINSIGNLPILPTIHMKLSRLLNAQNSSIKMISNIISEDQAVAAMVLKIVNSVVYGFYNKIGDLQHAIVILGLNEIKNLVLTASMYKIVKEFKSSSTFDMEEFWKHSTGCAILARVLAETAHLKNPEDVFTGGLLHDIGKLIHATYLCEKFNDVVANVVETGSQISESEKKILGFDHAQTGSVLAEKWNLPQETISMIAYHHLPDTPYTLTKEIAAIHIGNSLCISLGMGSGGEKRVPIVNQKAWEILDLKLSDLEYVMQKSTKLFEKSISIMEFE
ncbi:MAG: HDOD domain-containing protein [Deltaproteobacteria bacterium]|nr:HDOD domain-containing protein [Deltaproteobacteria bacterium]MBW2663020.1 HDOD domain-containing protein [Deltaproteobacteria bacterium]